SLYAGLLNSSSSAPWSPFILTSLRKTSRRPVKSSFAASYPPLNDHTPITLREIQIRFFLSIYWIWIAYLMLDLCKGPSLHPLQRDPPPRHPQRMATPFRQPSPSIQHPPVLDEVLAPPHITRRLVGMIPESRSEKIFIAFWTFLLSGLCHVVADWQAGEPCHPYDDLLFFVANFVAGAVELLVTRRLALVKRRRRADDDRVNWLVWSNTIKAVVGYVWVLGFFFCITPKWQYPKLLAVLT
ncbi:hypothetical protein N7519_001890, partial [Penicillium mononematosum]|uniref:uncharacterized protein n=1 Tax=Penicillium mononematosum TaxID=268346 RepID=UPI0025482660